MARKRIRKAKLLAYPADWFWSFAAGWLVGIAMACFIILGR